MKKKLYRKKKGGVTPCEVGNVPYSRVRSREDAYPEGAKTVPYARKKVR